MSRRMSFVFPQRSVARLDKIKEEQELTSYTDVVRQALRLYEWALEASRDGKEFYVKDANGNETKVDIFVSA